MSYIRRKRCPKRLKDGGKSYFYYYLVQGIRSEGKVKQVVLAYLGTADQAIDRLEAEQGEDIEALREKLKALTAKKVAARAME